MYSNSPIQDKNLQYFWGSFPVGLGRNGKSESDVKTTYLYTYMDAQKGVFLGRYPVKGGIASFVCEQCGRVLLYTVRQPIPEPAEALHS